MKALAQYLACTLLLVAPCALGAEEWFRGSFTGKELLAACKAATDESVHDFERGICRGFIEGFVAGRHVGDTWHAFHHREEKLDEVYGRLCIPKEIKKVALAVVFVQYLEKNTEKLNWNAGTLLEAAIKQAFPCPAKRQ